MGKQDDSGENLLPGATLTGVDLAGANLWHVNLGNANLAYADLSDADLSDAILQRLDYVIASVHSLFNLSREQQTKRVLRAMDSQHRRRVEARNNIIQGDKLSETGDDETARRCYQKALEFVPGFTPALLSLGKAELGAGNIEDGIRFFSEAIAADPDMADLRRQRAKALMSLKKYDEAIKDYTEVIRISSISAGKQLADAYYLRGCK